MRYLYICAGVLLLLGIGSFLWLDAAYHAPVQKEGTTENVRVEILEGDGVWTIAEKLKEKNLIESKTAFLFGVWRNGLLGTFRAGVYTLSRSLSPAEIAVSVSHGEAMLRDIRVTFPEGWTIDDMVTRLNEKGLAGNAFSKVVKHPTEELRGKHDFLSEVPKNATLEGFLFPDTYYFLPETTGEEIADEMLDTFSQKTAALQKECREQGRVFFDIVTMASILESEVRTDTDRRIVSGIFWKRIEKEMPLQSDATLEYVLGGNKTQHDALDLQFDSPYNTYRHKGLPPGPINNPSLNALDAALHASDSPYLYFLSDPKTGKTYFAKDFEEHKKNKEKVGL